MVKILTLLIGFLPINFIKVFFLKMLGHKLSYKSYIGVSFLYVNQLTLKENTKIKSFNFIKVEKLNLKENSFIGRFNYLKGFFDVFLENSSGISTRNKIRRSYFPVVCEKAQLNLGENSFIVANHFLDLTSSISIGKNSIIAGIRSQLWTHGYYHANTGKDRIRIDGQIHIGDNVYVGSGCIFNPGVTVANAIHIGGGSVVSKDLEKPGMYVGQGLRYIDNDIERVKSKLNKVKAPNLVEPVYVK
jgi:acetyltransferase-like isoleucine patch superfamily enzyme